ncbi:MAG: thiamine pyrophosphate-dependent dehydrogenase E1 component subunit alpha [Deltaproteobacteria bacterium]|nr:thiamine pyrophosphate-dependent dehydrogenase E1 component subunit alpha [Deltaproteobacteria bacterium]MBW2050757.1 thiamine pyrophosphate-dependent dehydrogenase E1 component subunit alpha [Deltaproteobacteria bacterium]MBW2141377.1 thiamine pyrophosphate-dependent dehydrogenase E1 component subunit alpha [Deltaproteobacteria bacterium]MBW2321983.1 thiamine pyrophosphate-dependent dehydrogenase E1 component subunit alpha [Deltaproteobacteria bacterium]
MKLKNDDLIFMYKTMVRTRKLDEITIKGLQEGKVLAFYHSSQGSEALAVGAASFLRPDDYLWAHHRGHGIGYILAKGGSGRDFLAEHYGKATGSCLGVSGFHFADPENGALGAAGTIGSVFPMSLGWGLAAKKHGRQQVTIACFGDGGSNRGTLHEAFNLSSVWKLPIVWICDNNGMAQYTPITDAYAKDDIADLATGYDIPAVVVDGMDIIAVHEAVQAAVEKARAGEGPSMIEAKTKRFREHSIGSPDVVHNQPRTDEEIAEMKKLDPIITFKAKLLEQGVLTKADVEKINNDAEAEMAEMDQFCVDSQIPDPSILNTLVYAE